PHPGPPRPAAPNLGAVPVHHQPRRRGGGRGSRTPPARPRRAGHPRPQRPSPGALPLRALLRQCRLDRDRRTGAQPAAPDPATRPAGHHAPHVAHDPSPAADDPRPTGPQRTPLPAATARPLAMGRRLPRRAVATARTPAASLNPAPA